MMKFPQPHAQSLSRSITPLEAKQNEGRRGPRLGQADVIPDLRMNEVRVELPGARFVRLSGTLRPGVLIDLARTLQAEEGSPPKFL